MRSPRATARAAALVWATAILVTGVLPTQGVVRTVSNGHVSVATVTAHFLSYMVLAILTAAAIGGWGRVSWSGAALAFVLATALGGAVELVQAPLPYRDAQAVDVLTNAAGAAAGLVALSCAARVERRRARRG